MARPAYRIRNLQALLDSLTPGRPGLGAGLALGWFLGVPLGTIAVVNFFDSGPLMWLTAFASFATFGAAWLLVHLSKRNEKRRIEELGDAYRALEEFAQLNRESTLEARLDPEVGDVLDRCAKLYLELDRVLDQPQWSQAQGHKLSARASVKAALKSLIGDALVVGVTGLRSKGMRRDSFARQMADPVVRQPMMDDLSDIESGLISLRAELGSSNPTSAQVTHELETALSHLTEVRAAEEELHRSLES